MSLRQFNPLSTHSRIPVLIIGLIDQTSLWMDQQQPVGILQMNFQVSSSSTKEDW